MRISELKASLPYLFKAGVVPLIWGHHGIGKSQSVAQYAKENGLGFIDLRLSLMEPGDLLGLADLSSGNTRFAPPSWLPKSGKGILFLDEINRARKDTQNASFQLVLDRMIHEYLLPLGWHVVAAANPPGDEYVGVSEMDAALLSRFCHVILDPSTEETLGYLKTKAAGNCTFFSYLKAEGLTQPGKALAISDYVRPDNRSTEAYLRILSVSEGLSENLVTELGYGLVGIHKVQAYKNWLKSQDKALTFEDMKAGGFEARLKRAADAERMDWIAASSAAIVETAETLPKEEFTSAVLENIRAYFAGIPTDAAVAFGRGILERSPGARETLGEDIKFVKCIQKLKIAAIKEAA